MKKILLTVVSVSVALGATAQVTFSNVNWFTLGSGVVGGGGGYTYVAALAVSSNGTLFAGGAFTNAGGVAANNIAQWNGTKWSPVGSGIIGTVYALGVSGGTLYAGGTFTNAGGVAANNIAQWNGTNWSALGSGMSGGSPTEIYALAVSSNGTLYAGGLFTNAGGTNANYIAQWSGSNWSPLGSGMSGKGSAPVLALAMSGRMLYAGGEFTNAGGVAANLIAQWNGTNWSPLGTGMNQVAYVRTLALSGTNLYVGGFFTTAGGVVANHIAQWNGSSWAPLGSGIGGTADYLGVYGLAGSGNDLYVGGSFSIAGTNDAACVAGFNFFPPPIISPGNNTGTTISSNGFQLRVQGAAGLIYQILASQDLITWWPIIYVTNTSGAFNFNDLDATNYTQRYYQATILGPPNPNNVPPTIISQPQSQTFLAGNNAAFSVTATGTSPLSYQWYKNGSPMADGGNVSGAAASTLTISDVSADDVASYYVVISNPVGPLVSSVASLEVNAVMTFIPALGSIGQFTLTNNNDSSTPGTNLEACWVSDNLWGLTSAGGNVIMDYNDGPSQLTASIDLSDMVITEGVAGYPEIQYGYNPNSGKYSNGTETGAGLLFPMTVGSLMGLESSGGFWANAEYSVDLASDPSLSVDFAYDIWITDGAPPIQTSSTTVELMVWLYGNLMPPRGLASDVLPRITRLALPCTVGGQPKTMLWDVYAPYDLLDGNPTVSFVLENPSSSGTVGVDLSAIVTSLQTNLPAWYGNSIWNQNAWPSFYVLDVELGSEFGNEVLDQLGTATYNWTLSDYSFVYPAAIGN